MTPEQYQRSYLLPPGCKDLIDVLRLKELEGQALPQPGSVGQAAISGAEKFSQVWKFNTGQLESNKPSQPLSALEVALPEKVSVSQLASLLGQKTFQIVANLMEFGVLTDSHQEIAFELAAKVLRKYGLIARKA